jgi:DNA-binding MarR family transcriptional regulator
MSRSHEGTLVIELIFEIFRLNGQLLEAGDRLAAPVGLTSARWQILGAIEGEGRPLTVAQISRRMGLSRQAVQRVANDLAHLGFVSFQDNPDHARAKLVVLTPSSVEALRQLDVIQSHWVNALAKGLTEAELKRTVKLLAGLRDRCEAVEHQTAQS